jgi:hypothetical protein
VTGLSPDGARWQACLNLESASALWAEEPEDIDDVSLWVGTSDFSEAVRRKRAELEIELPTSAQGALAWASAAGFGGSTELAHIEDLLLSQEVFVEELFDALLDKLGFPEGTEALNVP